jgi:hypothetical protein
MIPKSLPSGFNPMGGNRFFGQDHAQTNNLSNAVTSKRLCEAHAAETQKAALRPPFVVFEPR